MKKRLYHGVLADKTPDNLIRNAMKAVAAAKAARSDELYKKLDTCEHDIYLVMDAFTRDLQHQGHFSMRTMLCSLLKRRQASSRMPRHGEIGWQLSAYASVFEPGLSHEATVRVNAAWLKKKKKTA